jgi:hypothetical protein
MLLEIADSVFYIHLCQYFRFTITLIRSYFLWDTYRIYITIYEQNTIHIAWHGQEPNDICENQNGDHQENVIYYGTLQTTTEHYVVLCSKIQPTDD